MDLYKPKYFTLEEMKLKDETPFFIFLNALYLCIYILDPLREFLKKPIIVLSWYRDLVYNKLVGGAKNSQHTLGEAVDIRVNGMTIFELYSVIINLKLPFDQLILENDDNNSTWIHISLKRVGTNRREVLIAKKINGEWEYKPYK